MRKWLKRGVWISVLAAVLAAGGFVTSYAETRIGNVRLVFSDQLAEGRMLEPDVIATAPAMRWRMWSGQRTWTSGDPAAK